MRDALWLDRLPILARTEHEIADAVVQDRLFLLAGIERVDQRESFIVLVAKRSNRAAVERKCCRLCRRQARCHDIGAARDRHVDREVMTPELNHPWRGGRRRPEDADVGLGQPELNAAAAAAAARPAAGPAPSSILQDLVTVHDVGDLLIPLITEHRLQQRERGVMLSGGQIAESKVVALVDAARQVRPVGLLRAVESKHRLRTLSIV